MDNFVSTKLYQAIKDKNVDEVKELLNKGENCSARDVDGTSYLHAAVKLGTPTDIFKLLLEKVDISLRSGCGKTVADLIFSNEFQSPDETETALKLHTKQVILKGEIDKLEEMLLSGWSIWPVTAEQAKGVSQDLEDFIQKLPEHQKKIEQIHQAVESENVRELKNLLDRKKLLQAADRTGLPPFQKAVVLSKIDVVKEMANEFKDALNFQDGMGRTPLHYAGGKTDAGYMYEMLKTAGADEIIKDINGCTPKDYFDDPTKIGTNALQDQITEILQSPVLTTKQQQSRVPSAKRSGSGNKIYVSQDTRPRTGDRPTTIDGKYVADHLGTALTLALAELAVKRPKDPIEYLSQWLYNYKSNMDHNMRQETLIQELQQAEEMKIEEARMRESRKAEQKQLEEEERQRKIKEEEERKKKEQEELQRKAKEAALAQRPNLETVNEELEEEPPSKEKDSQGQTELHRLAAQEGADMGTLIKIGYSIAERDAEQRTARDIAESAGMTENVEAIDKYVKDLIKAENYNDIELLILEGYDKIESILESTADQSEDFKQFVSSIPDYLTKIQDVYTSIEKGDLRDVQQTLERKKLAIAKDRMGRCPLHIAVLTENNSIVEYIAKSFPTAVKCKDHMNRTPLHYAMGLSNEEIITQLLAHDADTTVKDVLKRIPSDYRDHSEDIKKMKEKLLTGTTQESLGQTIEQDTNLQQETQQETTSQQQEETTLQQQGEVTSQQEETNSQQQGEVTSQHQEETNSQQQMEQTVN